MRYSADVLMRFGVGIRARTRGPLADKLWQTQVARPEPAPCSLSNVFDLPSRYTRAIYLFSHPLRIRSMWRA